MGLEFRRRAKFQAQSLQKTCVDAHPLSPLPTSQIQLEESDGCEFEFVDPLRVTDGRTEDTKCEDFKSEPLSSHLRAKEWNSCKKILMQKFPISKSIPISMVSGVSVKKNRELQDDHQRFLEEDIKVISQQEYVSQLNELKDEIKQAWHSDDRVTALRLSIKVSRLLMDTSVLQFYPTLFVLVTDIMDMLGDMVWDRIKRKAEWTEDGGFVCSLPDTFKACDICLDATETCNNWFCKINSVRELLPRIYLELAILPCWRFLVDHPNNVLQRLVLMMRGISDPLASAYCRLYMVQCAQRLPQHDTGFLITCINDLEVILKRLISTKEATRGNALVSNKLLLTLIEPTIEYTVRYLFKNLKQMEVGTTLVALAMGKNESILFENCSCISIILHYILKELPIEVICFNALNILHLIENTDDCSFDQCLNFKLLGFRICERTPELSKARLVVDNIMQILSSYDGLDAYLMVADAYLDIIFENHLVTFTRLILDGIFERSQEQEIGENEMVTLQAILSKIIAYFGNIEDILSMNHFIDILLLMRGRSRNSISMHILSMATRNGHISDPTAIDVLFEVAQAFYDGLDFSNMRKEDYQHQARVISRFVFMIDYKTKFETQLGFLARCRGAFASIDELQEILVHSSNNLAVRAMRDGNSNASFIKSCLAFSEVTVPSIPTNLRQLNLYLETAEVAILGGFFSHSDGLIDAALNSVRNVDSVDEFDQIISILCKLCGMLVMVPGLLEHELTCILKHVLSVLESNSWVLPRMKIKLISAIVILSAALSENPFLYNSASPEVMGNDQLFPQELLSLCGIVIHGIVDIVMQEPSLSSRGKIALEACNCVASSFTVTDEVSELCSKLTQIAKSCLSVDDKFLQSTLKFLDALQFILLDN